MRTKTFIIALLIGVLFLTIINFSFAKAEYSLTIYAPNVIGGTSDVTVIDNGDGTFKINATNGDYETDRALVMAWLFNGSTGRVLPSYMNSTSIISSDIRDLGRGGNYGSRSGNIAIGTTAQYNFSFYNVIDNVNVSMWSYVGKSNTGSGGRTGFESPSGTTINEITITPAGNNNEIGINRVIDQKDNPTSVELEISCSGSCSANNNGLAYTIFLSKGNGTWTGYGSGLGSSSNYQYKQNYGIPSFVGTLQHFPEDNALLIKNSNYNFNVTAYGNTTLQNISLYVNDILSSTNNVSGEINNTIFSKTISESSQSDYYYRICDVLGVCYNSTIYNFTPSDFSVYSITYPSNALVGDNIDLSMILNLSSGTTLSNTNLIYNSVSYTTTTNYLGSNTYNISRIFAVPDVEGIIPFSFEFLLSTGELNSTGNYNINVSGIELDNCSTYTFPILNLSLFDERTKNSLTGTIEILLDVQDNINYNTIQSVSSIFENVNNTIVCSSVNLSEENLVYSAEIKYYSNDYVSEFYHIQRASVNGVNSIKLFDLNQSLSTQFVIEYENNNFVSVPEAIIQLQRKYISEGIYEIVEAPLTSNDGKAIVHADLDSNKYKATVVKDGVVLDIFENIVFECQNELSGECILYLRGEIDPLNSISIETEDDFAYSITNNIDTISVTFSVPSGTSSNINLQVTQQDMFGNTTLCNQTIVSAGGSISCGYNNATITDSYLYLELTKDGEPIAKKSYYIRPSGNLDFLDQNFIIAFIFILSLAGMAFSSSEWIVINGVMTMLLAGSLYLFNGLNFVMGLGSLMWLVIASAILIYKMAKQEDR